MDSGQEQLYKAICTDIKYSKTKKIISPESDFTPNYYNNQSYYAWFKFSNIEECDKNMVYNYTYIEIDTLFLDGSHNYEKFQGKRIYNLSEMIQQNRTLWFVRNYDEKTDTDYEIKLLDANVVEPCNFSHRYYETASDTLLWLSDLHFGENNVFKINVQSKADITLTEHIKNAYDKFDSIGGLIITGDITSIGKKEGFSEAKEFIRDLNRNVIRKLTSENIIFCPGNHDFVRKDENIGEKVPENVSDNPSSIDAYKEFYSSIHHLKPNKYMACGRKLLMVTGKTVEIVALNSLMLQQYKDFEGHGFLSEEQLNYVAKQMGWDKNIETNAIRIAIMHHHYLPTCLVEQIDVKKASSVVYDAERFMQWLIRYNVKILLHGHKHQSFVSKIGHYNNEDDLEIGEKNLKDIYIVGMGGTGAYNCENKFATLTFKYHEIELKFFRIYADSTEKDKCIQRIHIPI